MGMIVMNNSHLAVDNAGDSVRFETWIEVDTYFRRFTLLEGNLLLVNEIRWGDFYGEVKRKSGTTRHFQSF
jgi:hypothetical protein